MLWSKQDDLPELYGDVLEVWKPWTTTLSSHGIASDDHMAEEAPEQLAPVLAWRLSLMTKAQILLKPLQNNS